MGTVFSGINDVGFFNFKYLSEVKKAVVATHPPIHIYNFIRPQNLIIPGFVSSQSCEFQLTSTFHQIREIYINQITL